MITILIFIFLAMIIPLGHIFSQENKKNNQAQQKSHTVNNKSKSTIRKHEYDMLKKYNQFKKLKPLPPIMRVPLDPQVDAKIMRVPLDPQIDAKILKVFPHISSGKKLKHHRFPPR